MKTLRDVLTAADPLRNEPAWPLEGRQAVRKTVIRGAQPAPRRMRLAPLLAAIALVLSAVAGLSWLKPEAVSAATIPFEVRLAEEHNGPGLIAAAIDGSDRAIYLHPDAIVENRDIASVTVFESGSTFGVALTFHAEGAIRMQRATEGHLDRPLAILLDNAVAAAPVIRSAIGERALLAGDYTRAEAERIAAGIREF